MKNILVIKLGALGDFVLSFGPFAAIRAHHPGDRITLLTTAPFAELGELSPWFDQVLIDERPDWWNVHALASLAQKLQGLDFVYDLQTSGRSSRYHWLAGCPKWSGIAWGASHPHANPNRDQMHTIDRQRDQLAMAGIKETAVPNMEWLRTQPLALEVPAKMALLVPGAAPHRPAKRWPAASFGTLANALVERGYTPVVAGAPADTALAETIGRICLQTVDFTGKTSIPGLAALAGRAEIAIGNDTGPMHVAAAMGTRCIVLFSAESNPALTAPRGYTPDAVRVVQEESLQDLRPETVIAALF